MYFEWVEQATIDLLLRLINIKYNIFFFVTFLSWIDFDF